MTQMGFNLEKLKDVINEGELASHPELVSLLSATAVTSQPHKPEATASAAVVAAHISQLGLTSTKIQSSRTTGAAAAASENPKKSSAAAHPRPQQPQVDKSLSCKEIERDRGKPLSKYDRNVMIFDWLHGLDETATCDLT